MAPGIPFFLIRVFRYEFWPVWLFYLPMYFCGLTNFTAANPCIKYGGAFDVQRYDVLAQIDPEYTPVGIRIRNDISAGDLTASMKKAGLDFPIIAKPDIGESGRGVELVEDLPALKSYLDRQTGNIILQEYISWPVEPGVLYYQYPDGSGEGVTSVLIRDFLKVKGDGQTTLQRLMKVKDRAHLSWKYLCGKYKDRLGKIIPEGEEIVLEPIGNHNRGNCFRNGKQLINANAQCFFRGCSQYTRV
jgi:hypothetical protein